MGVELGELCPGQEITLESLGGKIVAIDAFNQLYQFLAIIRGPDGTPLKDQEGRVTSHLNGLFNRTVNLAMAGLLPVFVFDGKHHPLKAKTVAERAAVKQAAREAYAAALEQGDLETARSKASQTSQLTSAMVEQAKTLLRALGLPIVQAPGEGEAQASRMASSGQAHACASQDFDALLFGSPRLVRNLSVTGRRRLPGRQSFVDASPQLIDLGVALGNLQLSREQLVDVGLLIGTDFNGGIAGVGPKTAVKLVREHGSLDRILALAASQEGAVWSRIRDGASELGDVGVLRDLFLAPEVDPSPGLEWRGLDRRAVVELLVHGHHFSAERVEAALNRLAEAPLYRKQRSLMDFG